MMIYWSEYKQHEIKEVGKRKKVDNNIYSFDIETSSYLILNNKILNNSEYEFLSEDEQHECLKYSCMYIWMFSINENVYYGRTWDEFILFLDKLEEVIPILKIVYIHNLSFEFQYLKSILSFKKIMARKKYHPFKAQTLDYEIEFRCSYVLSNCALEYIPKVYNLSVEKQIGSLDYNKIRHYNTSLSIKELLYCEYDCLVLYYYIKEELKRYERVDKIPSTSTRKS